MKNLSVTRILLATVGVFAAACAVVNADLGPISSDLKPTVIVSTEAEPMASGKFQPTWESLSQYEVPEWVRDRKFGIWAHWGPQCVPEVGDWYARQMYSPGHGHYGFHVSKYGHPSEFGFKDIIHSWEAEKWEPEKLVAFYKRIGAQYFFAMANHHDNFDLWDSKYQPWNSVDIGPKQDIIGRWAKAARAEGLPFGVSVHASHAWMWLETSQGADKEGPKAGVPYDGKLTKADGKGTWWEGLDPQDLYAQNHKPAENFEDLFSIHGRWHWSGGTPPDQAYCEKFYNRTMDLINKYQPEMLYFDDTALPLWPVSDAGLKIASHFYNSNLKRPGVGEGALFGKILAEDQREALIWDIERGMSGSIRPYVWQTDTCLGYWHYDRGVYERGQYKSAKTVIHMLADIVSKNGNLLLNVPVRGDGSIDDKEVEILEGIGDWMAVNKEAIYATRPWKTFGEGPASEASDHQREGQTLTAEDIRYTASKNGKTLYAIVMGWPEKPVSLKSLGTDAKLLDRRVKKVELLGSRSTIRWKQGKDALVIETTPPKPDTEARNAAVFKVSL